MSDVVMVLFQQEKKTTPGNKGISDGELSFFL